MCCSNSGYYYPANSGYYNPYNSYNCYYTPNHCGCHNGNFYNGGMDCGMSSLSLIALFALLCR